MNNSVLQHLQCPICKSPLFETSSGLQCDNNHCFDRAKQGYYNLLPVQHKASKNPGDDKQMVQARREFLEQGHYHPFSQAINNLIVHTVSQRGTSSILDAGCGEGYYLSNLIDELAESKDNADLIGIDISKHAVIAASKKSKEPLWLVASAAKAPLNDHSMDLIYSLFTPLNSKELKRLLKADGTLITATSGEQHLIELRELLYQDVTIKPVKTAELLAEEFIHQQQQTVRFDILLSSPQQIDQLLKMTPHYWRSSPETKAKIGELEQLKVTAEFHIDTFIPISTAISTPKNHPQTPEADGK